METTTTGFELAREHIAKAEWSDAVRVLWEMTWDPQTGDHETYAALILIGKALMESGDYDAAISTAQRAASMFCEFSPPFWIVADAYRRIKQPRSALKTVVDGFRRRSPPQDWPEIDPDDVDLTPRRLFARILVDCGWHYEAMQVANDGLQDYVEDPAFREVMRDAGIGDARDRRYNL